MTEPFHIKYRTHAIRERQGALGDLARAISAHPIRAGLLGGAGAVLIAFLWSFKGATTDLAMTTILGAIVMGVWALLFWLMRGFFEQQTRTRVDVIRTLTLDEEDMIRWTEQGEVLRAFEVQSMKLWRKPSDPDDALVQALWVARGAQDSFILETRLASQEGRALPIAPPEIVEHVDERLPTHVVSGLLQRVRT